MSRKINLYIGILLFLCTHKEVVCAQNYANDTIIEIKKFQSYIDVSNTCLKYIRESKKKELKKLFYFTKQDRVNFDKNIKEVQSVINKYGLPTDSNILITTREIKIGDKTKTNIKVEYFFPELNSDVTQSNVSILFLFDSSDDPIRIISMQVYKKQSTDELLNEFENFNKKNK